MTKSPDMKKTLLFSFTFMLMALAGLCQETGFNSVSVQLRQIVRLPNELMESSGIMVSGPNSIWSHEDSGNDNVLYNFDTTGNLKRTLVISNMQNIDWEDLTVDEQERVYIDDAGNNNNNRTDLAIYRIPNPVTISGNSVEAEVIHFVLEDQQAFPPQSGNLNYDIEAIIWHSDSLFLFTKNRSTPLNGFTKMYKLPAIPGSFVAQLCDSLYIGSTNASARITSADINHLTGELVLLTQTKIVSVKNYPGNRFFDGQIAEYLFSTLPGQNEGLAFVTPYRLYMTEEGTGNSAGFLYDIHLPVVNVIEDRMTENELLKVFPNPVDAMLQIETGFSGRVDLELLDARGIRLKSVSINSHYLLDMGNFPKGVYFLRAIKHRNTITRRIIKY